MQRNPACSALCAGEAKKDTVDSGNSLNNEMLKASLQEKASANFAPVDGVFIKRINLLSYYLVGWRSKIRILV